MADRKVMVGPRLRRMRLERGLKQNEMAEQLGISLSYLNLIERNQRPVTVQLLLKLGQTYDIDLQRFAVDDEARVAALLKEVFSDPLFEHSGLTNQDIQDLASASPQAAESVFSLYRSYRALLDNNLNLAEVGRKTESTDKLNLPQIPSDDVQDFIQVNSNYFPDLEDAAEQLKKNCKLDQEKLYENLRDYLFDSHGIRVRILPFDVMEDTLHRYDRHGRRIMVSEILPLEWRTHQLAFQIALLDYSEIIDDIVKGAAMHNADSRRLLRISLANYMAGALVMPYDNFFEAAKSLRYDIELLGRRFNTNYEQVCNRLLNLHRPGTKGVPFFLARVDCAGNISRRLSFNSFHFASYGGICPRWGIQDAFSRTGETLTEIIEMPNKEKFISVARAIFQPNGGDKVTPQKYVMVIGCDISHANQLVYADGTSLQNNTQIGINCRLCDRIECSHRAYPPLNKKVIIDENHLGISPYFFT